MTGILFPIIISALLRFGAFPKFDFFRYACFIALVPVFFISFKTKKQRFLAGFAWGLLANSGIYYWLFPTIRAAGENIFSAFFIVMVLVVYISVYDGAFLLFSGFISKKKPILFCVIAAGLWVALEIVRTGLFSGFPWMLYGYSAYRETRLIQIADLPGGIFLVSFFLVFLNACLYFILTEKGIRKKLPAFLAFIIVFLAAAVYGQIRLKQFSKKQDQAQGLKIALLQGNIDQYKKWDAAYKSEIYRIYRGLYLDAVSQNADLIIMPETVVPGLLNSRDVYDEVKALLKLEKDTGVKVLFGAPYLETTGGERRFYNSAILSDSNLSLFGRYDKMHLVPFGEYVPMRKLLSRYFGVLNAIGDFEAGKLPKTFEVRGIRFSANICFESIFPGLVRQSAKDSDFIVNLTNDAWYLKTSGPYQHFMMNIFRAIENRKPVVRCANTGISAIINPDGSIRSSTALFSRIILYSTITPPLKKGDKGGGLQTPSNPHEPL